MVGHEPRQHASSLNWDMLETDTLAAVAAPIEVSMNIRLSHLACAIFILQVGPGLAVAQQDEIERIENAGGINIKDECIHVGGRGPARMLRRKILSLIPHQTETLILNFSGIEMVSSSFMDEFLGRLILEIGLEKFKNDFKLINVNEIVSKIANVVIEQRLSDHDKSGGN